MVHHEEGTVELNHPVEVSAEDVGLARVIPVGVPVDNLRVGALDLIPVGNLRPKLKLEAEA